MDIFYRKDTIVINNTAVNQQIVMGRTTAKLVLNIEDAIPQNVSAIGITLGSSHAYNMLDTSYMIPPKNANHDYDTFLAHAFTTAEIGKTNVKISMIVYNPDLVQNVVLTIYSPGLTTATVPIKNVKFIRNHITTLSGVVFSTLPSVFDSGFKISINTDWNTSTIGF